MSGISTGCIRMYDFIGDKWIQVADSYVGRTLSGGLGISTAITDDGNRIVVGPWFDSTNDKNGCSVRVLDYRGKHWTLAGNISLHGQESGPYGHYLDISVAISSDGSRIAIGETNSVSVFHHIENKWVLVRNSLTAFGSSLSFAKHGNNVGFIACDGNNVGFIACDGNNVGFI
eukprot:190070_1